MMEQQIEWSMINEARILVDALLFLFPNSSIFKPINKPESHEWDSDIMSTVKPLVKSQQIPKLKCFSSRLAVVFVQFIEARCLSW